MGVMVVSLSLHALFSELSDSEAHWMFSSIWIFVIEAGCHWLGLIGPVIFFIMSFNHLLGIVGYFIRVVFEEFCLFVELSDHLCDIFLAHSFLCCR